MLQAAQEASLDGSSSQKNPMKDFVWLVLQYHDYARMLVTDPGLRPGPENWKVIVPLVHWAQKMLVGT